MKLWRAKALTIMLTLMVMPLMHCTAMKDLPRVCICLGVLMSQDCISLGHEALALKSAHNHVDLGDDAFDAVISLLWR